MTPEFIASTAASVLGPMLRPPSLPSGPMYSGMAPITQGGEWDFSGFTVATGGSSATGAPNNKTVTMPRVTTEAPGMPPAAYSDAGPMVAGYSTQAVIGVAAFALAAILLMRGRRK